MLDTLESLLGSQVNLLRAVTGCHQAANKLGCLIRDAPVMAGKELGTTIAMFNLLSPVMVLLRDFSGLHLPLSIELNVTEKQAGSNSSATTRRSRPDTLIIYGNSTLMLGEDKDVDLMPEALDDLQRYASGGLGICQYASIPGLPAYAASGFQLQFCFIDKSGNLSSSGVLLDLSTPHGRLQAVCCTIQCYRLLHLLSSHLPRLEKRLMLWKEVKRGPNATIMLIPGGAVKSIANFKSFAKAIGSSKDILQEAYNVARLSAADQKTLGEDPFLVYASNGPTFSSRSLLVTTTPLGYHRSIKTEKDARLLAMACLKSAVVLHKAGIVHTDFRLSNTVWLDEEHCMVIDLEHCRASSAPLPEGCESLCEWDDGTLEVSKGQKFFTAASDIYQIGRMLDSVRKGTWSLQFSSFVAMLLSKKSPNVEVEVLDGTMALQHEWMMVND
jgi:hypothetical protein